MTKKRKTFTDAFKAKVALEAYKGLTTVNEQYAPSCSSLQLGSACSALLQVPPVTL